MKWEVFEERVIEEANRQHKTATYISSYLNYAKPLFDLNIPIIAEAYYLSELIGLKHEYICKMAFSPSKFYRRFEIRKTNGKPRIIDEPLPDLKKVQRWILDEILSKIKVSKYSKAYVKGLSLKHNARFHRAQKNLIVLDVKDFFPSIKIGDIYIIFKNIGYKSNIAWFLANLCCLDGKLPQGSPTSPCLANLRMLALDEEIGAYCYEENWRYTRYADDLFFSGNSNISKLIRFVSDRTFSSGFSLNSSKTRVIKSNQRQVVTGIVVNHHMQVSKVERKELRQKMYYINKFGIESHINFIKETRANYLLHLYGRINHALFINPKDPELKRYSDILKQLYNYQIKTNNNNV